MESWIKKFKNYKIVISINIFCVSYLLLVTKYNVKTLLIYLVYIITISILEVLIDENQNEKK